jgi:hypothetical protein
MDGFARAVLSLVTLCLLLSSQLVWAESHQSFGETLCKMTDYYCLIVKKGDSWDGLFPDGEKQDLVKRVNRMNLKLKPSMIIAIPRNLENLTIYDISPFPLHIEPLGEKIIYISQEKLAFAAYDKEGDLLWWGPISSGIGPCNDSDVDGSCTTPTGSFRIIRKQDADCISTVFPKREFGDDGGAPMPYCMHFLRGYALHGSDEVPGYRASHGCVRLFVEDAQWLNQKFIDLPGRGSSGTRVLIGASDEF